MNDADVLIAGGGPAGAAAAIVLARAGRRVTLIEREADGREKVCGEFLGGDAAACLDRLGLPIGTLGAVPIAHARFAREWGEAGFALPFPAWGLPRRLLDEALLQAAARAGATLQRGRAVREAAREGAAWRVRLDSGGALRAPHLMLATGKHALRGFARSGTDAGWVGAKLHLRLRVALDGVTLLPCGGGYAGLQPSTDGAANLCAALTPGEAAMARESGTFLRHVAAGSPRAAALLRNAEAMTPRPLAIAGIPYGFLHRDTAEADPALWRVGDQFAVIPSFLGDGMAMALAGGIAAAEAILAGETAPAFHARWRLGLVPAMRVAGLSNLLVRHMPGVVAGVIGIAPGAARLIARSTRVVPSVPA